MKYTNYWKAIFNTMQDCLMVVDSEGIIQAANPSAERITGYTVDELIGNSCRILNCTGCKIFGENREGVFCKLFRKGKVREKECTITNKFGHTVEIIKNASILRDENGSVIGAVEIFTDISEAVRQNEKIESFRKALNLNEGYHDLIGKSQVMQKLFEMIEHVAKTDAPVMIDGQSGTGKELVAMAIHEASPRRNKSFIKVNCASLNENLLESELFGHVKGSYSGAERDRIGRFEAAHEGSIFLDEIGDIPISTQVKLLRVIEAKTIERVGDHQPIPVDVRIITATNKNLEKLIEKGLFREDLFFRINVFPLTCPSLAQRREDIPLLAQSFIMHNNTKNNSNVKSFTPVAMDLIVNYSWPGNVRELRNAIEYAMVLCTGKLIGTEHLPPKISVSNKQTKSFTTNNPSIFSERENLIQVLKKTYGNQSEAAKLLGVSRVTIWKKIKKYGINLKSDLL
ncbi:MAG: sigma 54-interacting transcriptional regulator [Desulfobacterales bacterium]|nr:sigma 54-interacting transcriptional regulator [Desulfobacteraceae bacterium]MBT7086479.1 sigma 54-interacting transcriptional regulator [Desulfobacterales bacterium]